MTRHFTTGSREQSNGHGRSSQSQTEFSELGRVTDEDYSAVVSAILELFTVDTVILLFEERFFEF